MTDQLFTRGTLTRYGIRLMLAAAVTVSASCSELARQGRSPSFLIIESLTSSGTNPLLSDVLTNGGTFNDIGTAILRAELKNQGALGVPTSPTVINLVTITRYHVEFRRADGRNEPGRDVPYGFDGATTVTLPGTVVFDLVRHNNKEEPPLRNLAGFGGQNQINTIAEVTFYGRDQAGNELSVTGLISVNFSDFADPS